MRAGLEVHQQLSTGKLFCRCPCAFSESSLGTFSRRLSAAGGEERAIDQAATFQAARGLLYRYEVVSSSCLVEMDEEPPHALDPRALEAALLIARLLRSRVVDEIEVMRKIVIDGSNPSGFQRTALIAVGGEIEVRGRRYPIESICLEEDAARKIGERPGEVTYRLDRLGIPLLEIATAPVIESGREAREVAEELGALLRSTDRVRRGIGSIREDLNVSVEGGRRIEIKGVQELRAIESYVEGEARRQETLLAVRDALRAQGAKAPRGTPVDLSDRFTHLKSGPLAPKTDSKSVVLGLALPGFAGRLTSPAGRDDRLGRELAEYARAFGPKGLIHSDELPGHGLEADDVARIREALSLGPQDAFVLVADASARRATDALRAVAGRAEAALEGIPGETRDPLPDGRTRYSRPIPGRHRMYPETDVPPIAVDPSELARLDTQLPELPSVLRLRLERDHHLDADLVGQIVGAGEAKRFEELTGLGHAPNLVARLLTQELPAADSEGADGPEIEVSTLDRVLSGSERGMFAKEGIPRVLLELKRGAPTVEAATQRAGLTGMTLEELDRIVKEVLRENPELVSSRGPAAFSALMGDVMKKARGRADGEAVAKHLRAALEATSSAPGRSE